MMEFRADTPEVVQFNELCLKIAQGALEITGMDTVDDETLAVLRRLRSTVAVVQSALQQVAAIQTAGFSAIPP